MTKPVMFRRWVVGLVAAVTLATALATIAERASAGVRFSDTTEANVLLSCQLYINNLQRMVGYSTATNYDRPTYFRLWVVNADGRVVLFRNWDWVGNPAGITIDLSGAVVWRWVYVQYARYVNGWEYQPAGGTEQLTLLFWPYGYQRACLS
jgi:hypothetical protein